MIQLKDMNEILSTKQPIRLVYPTGESNIANIWDFENWKDCVVKAKRKIFFGDFYVMEFIYLIRILGYLKIFMTL